ncbi:MAG: DEAD/DEAH box helicase family protein [Anaerolineae bacterium]|nr:DEAD/DEAH box helicase family protein [Anaerolineae bacterium]
MKLHFDPNQTYQLDAVQSAVDLFDGQPLSAGEFAFSLDGAESGVLLTEEGIGNNLLLDEDRLLENLRSVQARNGIEPSKTLQGLHFSIEMETGTGKTYVYLRTLYELNQHYGFTKFVIVVPSIAIREGVVKNLEITKEHFETLYARKPATHAEYDSARVSSLRNFAASNAIQILVINIDAFAKDANIINRPNDKLSGKNPIEFIRATHPIVIVDEPQRMETDLRKQAIANLNPLCTLRYSATHLERYNPVYTLNPVQAYDLGLVKQIEVDSVTEESAYNGAYVEIEQFLPRKTYTAVRLSLYQNTNTGVQKKSITAKVGEDLYQKSNQREAYQNGYVINEIDSADESIEFSNGQRVYLSQPIGAYTDAVMKMQLRRMIDEHFKKARRLEPQGIKVLSLVFIDRVANYRVYDRLAEGEGGKFARWFEEIYREYAADPHYRDLYPYTPAEVHNGYFAQDSNGHWKDSSEGRETIADSSAYELIMRKKEELLDINTPLRFIFSHSALREGWDNPNVFQICTLNETHSDIKKRQEIGRGMRLCVNQQGQRVWDRQVNRLTVFANETYEDFARQLQAEIEDETGVQFGNRVKNRRERQPVTYRKEFYLDQNFLDLWGKIQHKTTYRVAFDSAELVKKAANAIHEMPAIHPPRLRSSRARLQMSEEEGVTGHQIAEKVEQLAPAHPEIPDILGYIENRTNLTRRTILRILKTSGRLPDVLINPQQFLDQAIYQISVQLQDLMIAGIKYETLDGQSYDMMLFEAKEIESYIDTMLKVNQPHKTITDYIIIDSGSQPERQFAQDCESNEAVEFFLKLPDWFVIQTPIGPYNPDWALILKNDRRLYFVAETKSVAEGQVDNLRRHEKLKIDCGKAHFAEFDKVAYRQVRTLSELMD